jgi:hypothetical protein
MKDNDKSLTAERIAEIADKGIRGARLTSEEKAALLNDGMGEVCSVSRAMREKVAPLSTGDIDSVIGRFFPQSEQNTDTLAFRIGNAALELLSSLEGWIPNSPAFAVRAEKTDSVSFYKELGKISVHIELIKRSDRNADLNFKIKDEAEREETCYSVELLSGSRCIEAVSAPKTETVSIKSLKSGDYELKICDSKGTITALTLRVE